RTASSASPKERRRAKRLLSRRGLLDGRSSSRVCLRWGAQRSWFPPWSVPVPHNRRRPSSGDALADDELSVMSRCILSVKFPKPPSGGALFTLWPREREDWSGIEGVDAVWYP